MAENGNLDIESQLDLCVAAWTTTPKKTVSSSSSSLLVQQQQQRQTRPEVMYQSFVMREGNTVDSVPPLVEPFALWLKRVLHKPYMKPFHTHQCDAKCTFFVGPCDSYICSVSHRIHLCGVRCTRRSFFTRPSENIHVNYNIVIQVQRSIQNRYCQLTGIESTATMFEGESDTFYGRLQRSAELWIDENAWQSTTRYRRGKRSLGDGEATYVDGEGDGGGDGDGNAMEFEGDGGIGVDNDTTGMDGDVEENEEENEEEEEEGLDSDCDDIENENDNGDVVKDPEEEEEEAANDNDHNIQTDSDDNTDNNEEDEEDAEDKSGEDENPDLENAKETRDQEREMYTISPDTVPIAKRVRFSSEHTANTTDVALTSITDAVNAEMMQASSDLLKNRARRSIGSACQHIRSQINPLLMMDYTPTSTDLTQDASVLSLLPPLPPLPPPTAIKTIPRALTGPGSGRRGRIRRAHQNTNSNNADNSNSNGNGNGNDNDSNDMSTASSTTTPWPRRRQLVEEKEHSKRVRSDYRIQHAQQALYGFITSRAVIAKAQEREIQAHGGKKTQRKVRAALQQYTAMPSATINQLSGRKRKANSTVSMVNLFDAANVYMNSMQTHLFCATPPPGTKSQCTLFAQRYEAFHHGFRRVLPLLDRSVKHTWLKESTEHLFVIGLAYMMADGNDLRIQDHIILKHQHELATLLPSRRELSHLYSNRPSEAAERRRRAMLLQASQTNDVDSDGSDGDADADKDDKEDEDDAKRNEWNERDQAPSTSSSSSHANEDTVTVMANTLTSIDSVVRSVIQAVGGCVPPNIFY